MTKANVTLDDLKTHEKIPNTVVARLKIPADVDFRAQLHGLKESGANDLLDTFGSDPAGEGVENPWLLRPYQLGDQIYLMRLAVAEKTKKAVFIELRLSNDDSQDEPPTRAAVDLAMEQASRRFWWDLDMAAVRAALGVNQYGEELLARYFPTRPYNLANPWDGLLRTVISNQIFPGLAVRLQRNILETYSDRVARFDGTEYRLFPTPQRLAQILPEDLLGIKFSRQKAKFLPGIGQALLDKPEYYDFERLRHLPGTEAVAILDELPGVGPWTSNYVAMRGLPHPDVFVDEAGLRKSLAITFDRRADLSGEELAKLTEVYAPYRSVACYYTYMKMYSV